MLCIQHNKTLWDPDANKYPLLNKVATYSLVVKSLSPRHVLYVALSEHNPGSWIDILVKTKRNMSFGFWNNVSEPTHILQIGSDISFQNNINMEFKLISENSSEKYDLNIEANTKFYMFLTSGTIHNLSWFGQTWLGPERREFSFFLFGEVMKVKLSTSTGMFPSLPGQTQECLQRFRSLFGTSSLFIWCKFLVTN